jgi:hypothetical protein
LWNAILDKFFLRIYDHLTHIPVESIRKVYKHTTENSSLRDLIVTIFINTSSSGLLQSHQNEVWSQFMEDCLRAAANDKMVPLSNNEQWQTTLWLKRKRKRICKHYHMHEEDSDEDNSQD